MRTCPKYGNECVSGRCEQSCFFERGDTQEREKSKEDRRNGYRRRIYASEAMKAMLIGQVMRSGELLYPLKAETIAREAFRMADMMVAAEGGAL